MNFQLNKPYLRSAHFQMLLFAATFVGAVVLAIAALSLRGVLFEPYCLAKFPKLEQTVFAKELAEGKGDPKRLKDLPDAELHALFGTLVNDPESDPHDHVAKALLSVRSASILDKIRITLVLGNREQRMRSVELLARFVDSDRQAEAAQLCRFARDKAWRRGETDLQQQAETVLVRLE
jgi:hypothetical protein